MNILVIKQTSLGDVLHSTGMIRSIKQAYPEAKLVLLTATSSLPIYQYNPWVDEIIEFDRYAIKFNWLKKPLWCVKHIYKTIQRVRAYQYDKAFDLQGLLKSVIFLYAAKANEKYVKGRWLGLDGFHNRDLHAIVEMQRVLETGGITVDHPDMEIHGSQQDQQQALAFIKKYQGEQFAAKKIIVISPFTRAVKKDWPLHKFMQLAKRLSANYLCVFTGAPERACEIDQAMQEHNLENNENIVNAAGEFGLLAFAEFVELADIVVSADSFAVHLAGAKHTPVIALFGPTDESKVGPLGAKDIVLRAAPEHDTNRVSHIQVEQVVDAIYGILD